MGHKVNPDIFRLGITKTWSYQLRTNRNFIKNLFLFRMLKNLFVNYNIPLFTFKKHRNVKFNDKLILKGEQQLVRSPFVSKNILFSNVIFGMLNKDIYIESYFIDANMKQQTRKVFNPSNQLIQRAKEYQHWEPGFYKKKMFNNLFFRKKKLYYNLIPRDKYKMIFCSRKFRKLARKSKIFVVKPTRTLSKHFYFFSKNYNWKYNRSLDNFLNKRRVTKKRRKFRYDNKSFRFPFYQDFFFLRKRYCNLFFYQRKIKRYFYRFRSRFARPLRYLRKRKYFRLKRDPHYQSRRYYSNKRKLLKIRHLAKKTAGSLSKVYLKKKSLPKTPLKLFNNIYKQRHFFYNVYHNLKVLKYFIRVLKFSRFFGIKKRIFYFHNLISLLLNFMGVAKKTIISKKFFVIIQTLIYYSYSLSFFNFTVNNC